MHQIWNQRGLPIAGCHQGFKVECMQVGGYKTGKSIFLKMLKSLFASRAGCTTSCTDFSSDVVTVISSVSDATTTRHTFEFRVSYCMRS